LYCLFMAAVVLLLDVCFNGNAGGRREHEEDDPRKTEVVQAFRILEEAKQQTDMASRLLDALMTVVRKHRVILPSRENSDRSQQEQPPPSKPQSPSQHLMEEPGHAIVTDDPDPAAAHPEPLVTMTPSPDDADAALPYFDEIWNNFDGGMQLDSLDLDTMFGDLQSFAYS